MSQTDAGLRKTITSIIQSTISVHLKAVYIFKTWVYQRI